MSLFVKTTKTYHPILRYSLIPGKPRRRGKLCPASKSRDFLTNLYGFSHFSLHPTSTSWTISSTFMDADRPHLSVAELENSFVYVWRFQDQWSGMVVFRNTRNI